MTNSMRLVFSTIILLCVLICSVSGFCAAHPGEKMARGFMNVWNGQYALTDDVHNSMYYEGPVGFFPGVFKGAGAMAVRSLSGIYDIIFFWLPVPKNWDPLVQPELNM
ncbi:MAG: exosortase system-associated protein, TIGR04073 family [Candidatus Auribacterota bacterium]